VYPSNRERSVAVDHRQRPEPRPTRASPAVRPTVSCSAGCAQDSRERALSGYRRHARSLA